MSAADKFAELKSQAAARLAAAQAEVTEAQTVVDAIAEIEEAVAEERAAFGADEREAGFQEGLKQHGEPGDKVFSNEEYNAGIEEAKAPYIAAQKDTADKMAALESQMALQQQTISDLQAQAGTTQAQIAEAVASVKATIASEIEAVEVDNNKLVERLKAEATEKPVVGLGLRR